MNPDENLSEEERKKEIERKKNSAKEIRRRKELEERDNFVEEKEFTKITDDGGIQRRRIKLGIGEFPAKGDFLELRYEGRLATDNKVFESSKTDNKVMKFRLGVDRAIRGVQEIAPLMKLGEVIEIKLTSKYAFGKRGYPGVPKDTDVIYELELTNFYEPHHRSNYFTLKEKIEKAQRHKQRGLDDFYDEEYKEAIAHFDKSIDILTYETPVEDYTPEFKDKLISLFLNKCNCFNKLGKWEETIKEAKNALDIKNDTPKAYYYRAIAYQNLDEFNNSEADFKVLREYLKNDDAVEAAYSRFLSVKEHHKKNQGKLFKSVFTNKIYDDTTLINKEKSIPTEISSKNPQVFLSLTIGKNPAKLIKIELFKNEAPRTCENFLSLCKGDNNTESFLFHYKGCPFHCIKKNEYIVGGDIENWDGTGGYSIFGRHFDDEKFIYPHSQAGLLSMYNKGENTNGSQFLITLKEQPQFNDKYVVFGRVIEGIDILWEINEVNVDDGDQPEIDILIEDCGEVKA